MSTLVATATFTSAVEPKAEPEDAHAEVEAALAGLRPAMEADAGGVELVSVSGGVVSVRMKGTCLVCPSVMLTLRRGIEPALRHRLPWVLEVRRVD